VPDVPAKFLDLIMTFVPVILCVDDDDDDLFFIKEIIGSQGHSFEIIEARNGLDALNYLQDGLKKSQMPCLIIMDMNMPRMDGKQTISKIKESQELSKIPVVVFTTSSNVAHQKFFESQGIRFITKPFDYKVFTKEIINVLAYCADLGA
jgi:CheY-like chemotaxis protein